MIEDLLKLKKITKDHYNTYLLFSQGSGKEWLDMMMKNTFFSQPSGYDRSESFSYAIGRMSLVKDIYDVIGHINKLIEEMNNV